MTITIPRPALVLLVGVSGSGKSTFARRHFHATEIVSSDGCRALVCDDEADQSVSGDAFELLRLILEKRLRRGKLAVVDATNAQGWARASLLAIAQRCCVPAIAIVFDLPAAVTAQQNLARADRVVNASVIAQQTEDLKASLAVIASEGFRSVHVLRSREDVDAAKIDYS